MLSPIGVIRTPFVELSQTPRQPALARETSGTIELHPGRGFEFALEDLAAWRYIWAIFWFDRSPGWRAKVRPPRSRVRRGVFATRSPHRPNPIGLSVLELVGVEGLILSVRGVDMLDQTPVLDLKPYVAYTDAVEDAGSGWLSKSADGDPGPAYDVELSAHAAEQAAFLQERYGLDLAAPISRALALGPAPHPYRRIKRDGDALRLAYKDWRARFCVAAERVTVLALATGYRAKELERSAAPELEPHRAFVERYGYPGDRR